MLRCTLMFSVALLLVSCGAPSDLPHEAAPDLFPTLHVIAQRGGGSIYALYEDHIHRFHEDHILFFSTPHDPFSQRSDAVLRRAYGSGIVKYPTYNIDFSSSTGSRLSYGVFVPDTFVLVSGTGARILSIIHPSEKELLSVVGGVPLPQKRR